MDGVPAWKQQEQAFLQQQQQFAQQQQFSQQGEYTQSPQMQAQPPPMHGDEQECVSSPEQSFVDVEKRVTDSPAESEEKEKEKEKPMSPEKTFQEQVIGQVVGGIDLEKFVDAKEFKPSGIFQKKSSCCSHTPTHNNFGFWLVLLLKIMFCDYFLCIFVSL